MYQFSRAVYRELGPLVEFEPHGCDREHRRAVLESCERAFTRLANDRHYFARPTRSLFNDVRVHFPMNRQMEVYRVIDALHAHRAEYVVQREREGLSIDGSPLCCHASTRKGTAVPARARCPAASTARRTSTSRRASARSRKSSSPPRSRALARVPCPHAPGRRRRRDVHRRRAARRRAAGHRQGAEHPDDQSEGVIAAVEAALERAGARAGDVERFVHGMTVGTNALLEGKVARTALLATEGFTDLEALGRQARAELYRLCAGHPPPLVPDELRVAVPERTGPDGVLRELDEDALRERLDGRRRRVGRGLPAVGLPPPRARAARRGAARRRAPRLDLARDRRRVPRVRALRDHRRRRRALPAPAPLPRAARRARAGRGAAGARGDALRRRRGRRRDGRPARVVDRAVRPRRRRGGCARLAERAGRSDAWGSTWAARRATCRSPATGGRARPAAARWAAARWRCRWLTSTRSVPAAGASPGATRAAPCAWARGRRARTPARPLTGAAATSRP